MHSCFISFSYFILVPNLNWNSNKYLCIYNVISAALNSLFLLNLSRNMVHFCDNEQYGQPGKYSFSKLTGCKLKLDSETLSGHMWTIASCRLRINGPVVTTWLWSEQNWTHSYLTSMSVLSICNVCWNDLFALISASMTFKILWILKRFEYLLLQSLLEITSKKWERINWNKFDAINSIKIGPTEYYFIL